MNFQYNTICAFRLHAYFISHDLFFWFLGIEMQSFCFYALAVIERIKVIYKQMQA